MNAKPLNTSDSQRQSYLPTSPQICALSTIVISVALLALSSFALAGVYSPSSAFAAFGDHFGELGSYLMLGGASVALTTLAVVVCVRNRTSQTKREVPNSKPIVPQKSTASLDLQTPKPLENLDEHPLVIAALEDNFDTLKQCLASSVVVNTEVRGQAVKYATVMGNYQIVEALLQNGLISKEDRGIAIRDIADRGDSKFVNLLLAGDVEILEQDRWIAITCAIRGANEKLSDASIEKTQIEKDYIKILQALLSCKTDASKDSQVSPVELRKIAVEEASTTPAFAALLKGIE